MIKTALERGLARIALLLVGITLLAGSAAGLVLTPDVRGDVWIGLAVVLIAMLIGFVPLRSLLRAGPDRIVAAWVAAMILRMFACLIGLVVILKRYGVGEIVGVSTVCGGYFVLLMIETVGMVRLMRRQFADERPLLDGIKDSQEDR